LHTQSQTRDIYKKAVLSQGNCAVSQLFFSV